MHKEAYFLAALPVFLNLPDHRIEIWIVLPTCGELELHSDALAVLTPLRRSYLPLAAFTVVTTQSFFTHTSLR